MAKTKTKSKSNTIITPTKSKVEATKYNRAIRHERIARQTPLIIAGKIRRLRTRLTKLGVGFTDIMTITELRSLLRPYIKNNRQERRKRRVTLQSLRNDLYNGLTIRLN